MKRRSCVVSIQVLDLPKKQRVDMKTCVPFSCEDLSALPTLIECKPNLKRTAKCIEAPQSQKRAKESEIYERRKSHFDDCVHIVNPRTMPCENAQPLKTTGSNFEWSDEFNCFNYWRVAPPDLQLDDATSTCSRMEEGESTFVDSRKTAHDEFNSFHYWRSSLSTIDELN